MDLETAYQQVNIVSRGAGPREDNEREKGGENIKKKAESLERYQIIGTGAAP